MTNQHMLLEGEAGADGTVVSVRGSYPAPEGPDWGWRIVVEPPVGNAWRFLMYNITPDGQEMLAVEARFSRA